MALVDVISISLTDFSGKTKALALYTPSGQTIVQLQALTDNLVLYLDPVIDAEITGASVTIALDISGMKSAPINGNRVREGALLTFDVEDSTHNFGIYVPSWSNAGFAADTPLESTIYGAAITALLSASDDNGNEIDTYIKGKRTFRK